MERRTEALGLTGERVGQHLRQLRRARGLTLQQLAEKLRELGRPILLSALSKIEKGQRRLDVDDLVAIALAMDVTPNSILLPDESASDVVVQLTSTVSMTAASAWEWASRRDLPQAADKTKVNVIDVPEFASQLRGQVAALHGHMRLHHVGISRSVPYDQLYVEPVLRSEQGDLEMLDMTSLVLPGQRSVILGNPGAGKSTLLAKLAHDIAFDRLPGGAGRVPFLLLLRHFASSFRTGDRSLVHYLEQVCRDPYNVEPPPNAVEHLLLNGRAVVLLDGLDELVEPELRRKFDQLIDGFVHHYPLVPVVVTARQVGYDEASLDRRLFRVGFIADRDHDQVRRYVEHWFALDEATPPMERSRLASSFIAESTDLAKLRANPLILALLCEMYSHEHYLPRNLATVYERCAVMMFDRWDRTRGISQELHFAGQLRSAVQYLAWRLLDSEEPGKAQPRRRIVQILIDHLVAKNFDHDEASERAEQFIEYCTGRSWVMTDMGVSGSGERLYGFTHRTFLEYFAAEHLVRTHSTAPQLWDVLRSRVLARDWGTVAQIALQLLDSKLEDGAEQLLRIVLEEKPGDPSEGQQFREFAISALDYLYPASDTLTKIQNNIATRDNDTS
ncbi:NACHT domain-containing protein [Amycolatopsis sp. QT-25]|uniref:NACHT domain-containing protein n=1 Tax=Amycolatopsis sp. QT-25 TaxID=3034022 RepID=UPI0023ECD415|nr:helix-turn-helix domain-containing protein [Amycolatopsis sp. QT-25]WET81101.1 NACHT domain-containing protein [Amycolatopsis sp. QT-25]